MNVLEIRLAIAGIGNATSGLLQSLVYYSIHDNKTKNLSFSEIGGYSLNDIIICAAFDVAESKVGKSLDQAIFAKPNVTKEYVSIDDLASRYSDIKVQKGPLLDGINETVKSIVTVDVDSPEASISDVLKQNNADILLWCGPSGAEEATFAYAQAALEAKCAFINSTPTPIVTTSNWAKKYGQAGLVLVGDDLQSQAGGTRIHKGILEVLSNFGIRTKATYQLDISGGAEELASLDRKHRVRFAKRKIKSQSISASSPNTATVVSGTSDYLDFLENERTGYFRIDAVDFMGGDISIDLTIRSDDAPNAAGTLVDVIRAIKLAIDRKSVGVSTEISGYGFKSPPAAIQESEASIQFRKFVK